MRRTFTGKQRRRFALWSTCFICAFFGTLAACSSDDKQEKEMGVDAFSGGSTSIDSSTSNAFSTPAPNLEAANLARHLEGDLNFEAVFVTAPAVVNSGLGPVFNAASCEACHPRDGRGAPPAGKSPLEPLLLRLSIPGANPDGTGSPNPVPGFGAQLQDSAIFGTTPEGLVEFDYTEIPGAYGDGTPYSLRQPTYTITQPYQALPNDLMISPRIGPPVFGLGLLEALDESTILDLSDPLDQDGDGISGKPNFVWDVAANAAVLGRFGWKANQPTLLQQVAAAYRGDIGVTSPYFPTEDFSGQPQDDGLQDDPEITQDILDTAVIYVQTLAVPMRRDVNNPLVKEGEQLFSEAGCASCHTPTLTTGKSHPFEELRNQKIHPFTDMLLHDMGDGLADGRPDFEASGREWRTAPLWGIGLSEVVNGHTHFLHDGRARNLEEAILWHGGEAENAKEFFRTLSQEQRAALIAFLKSN